MHATSNNESTMFASPTRYPGMSQAGLANDMELAHSMPVCRNILLSTALWQSPLQQGIDRLVIMYAIRYASL